MAIFITVGEYNNNAGNGEIQPSIKLPSTPPVAPVSPVVNPDGNVTYASAGGAKKYMHIMNGHFSKSSSDEFQGTIVAINEDPTPIYIDHSTGESNIGSIDSAKIISYSLENTDHSEYIGYVMRIGFGSTNKTMYILTPNGRITKNFAFAQLDVWESNISDTVVEI